VTAQSDQVSLEPLQPPGQELVSPFSSGGLVDVFRRRYLLKLLVQKEVRSRYQGSVLGLLWSYVQPLVRFCMYFFVIGLVLGLHKNLPNFAIHMFAAIVGVHFFTETFSSGTRSIVRNKAIVRKMAMPREMFPVGSLIVSAVDTFPQVLILFIASVVLFLVAAFRVTSGRVDLVALGLACLAGALGLVALR
jgi:ABC-2 type transport system permease protein